MNPIRAICVFCASSSSVDQIFCDAADDLGRKMGELDIELVYGGASIGLMGSVARGVHATGGKVVGVLPQFMKTKDIEYAEADELIVTRDMRERKAVMDDRSDAFIALPGGIGTQEELMEILSMKQLQLNPKPLVVLNTQQFYDKWVAFIQDMIARKFTKASIEDLFFLANDSQSALDYILRYERPFEESKWL
jgi:uncharacterized protein (TIGR00730 family)